MQTTLVKSPPLKTLISNPRKLIVKSPYSGYRIFSADELLDVFIDGKINEGKKSHLIRLLGVGNEKPDEVLCCFEESNKLEAISFYRRFRQAVVAVKTKPGGSLLFEI